ncbi:MAG: RHS repeat-associated core domain-containing protein [Acidiferrobacterales bacterium]
MAETALQYNRARYYDPGTGRFVSSDPVGLAGGLNTYAYVENSPLRWTDRFGLAIGDYPPAPPGWNSSWPTGQWDAGRWWTQDPNGNTWKAHPEDPGHWRRWGIQGDPNGNQSQWPSNPGKLRPGQKKPKSNQCPTDPNGDTPPWSPPVSSDATPDVPAPPDTVPFMPWIEPWPLMPGAPIWGPIFVPAL